MSGWSAIARINNRAAGEQAEKHGCALHRFGERP